MKKTGILAIVMLFVSTAIFAQPNRPQPPRDQMRQYIEKNVTPFLQSQKELLTASFSKDEKAELSKIQQDFETFKSQGQQVRESMQGHYNAQMAKMRKEGFDTILSRADALLATHSKEVAAYKKVLATKKAKWLSDIKAMRPNFDNMNKRPPFKQSLIDRLDNPSFVLLWDGNSVPWHRMNSFRQGGNRHGRMGMNRRGPRFGNKKMSPEQRQEIREKVKAYAKKNIVPVVLAEQKEFEATLSRKELKQIDHARQQVLARKKMLQNRGFTPNASKSPLRNDSTRLTLRIKRQKAMMPVQEIALKHYTEIEKHLAILKKNFPKWRSDLTAMISQNSGNLSGRKMPPFMHNRLKRLNSPMAFLLFDKSFVDTMNPMKAQ